jgi:hypothetical protein
VPASVWLGIWGLARHYGWEPRGTLPPHPDFADDETPEFFDGCYYPPYGQVDPIGLLGPTGPAYVPASSAWR